MTKTARGRVVGRVMSGLMMGILLARVASGVVSDVLGWQGLYWTTAALILLQAMVLHRTLPVEPPQSTQSYRTLLLIVA